MAECSLVPDEVGPPGNENDVVALDLIAFRCPLQPQDQRTYEDILVTVNFTMLNFTADLASRTRWNSVQVFLGVYTILLRSFGGPRRPH